MLELVKVGINDWRDEKHDLHIWVDGMCKWRLTIGPTEYCVDDIESFEHVCFQAAAMVISRWAELACDEADPCIESRAHLMILNDQIASAPRDLRNLTAVVEKFMEKVCCSDQSGFELPPLERFALYAAGGYAIDVRKVGG